MAATKAATVPRAVRSPQIPPFGYLSAATPAAEATVGVVVLAGADLPIADGTIPWWGCAAPTAHFLQHLVKNRRDHRRILRQTHRLFCLHVASVELVAEPRGTSISQFH